MGTSPVGTHPLIEGRRAIVLAICLTLLLGGTLVMGAPSTARASGEYSFCTNFNAGPDGGGNAQCHGTTLVHLTATRAKRGAQLACASSLTQMGLQYGEWWCTTTGEYVTRPYGGEFWLYPLIKNDSSSRSNIISGWAIFN